MAFDETPPRNDYIGTGTVAAYDFGFRIFDETDLRVTQQDTAGAETALVWPTDFTVPVGDVNNPNGGTITLVAGNLPADYLLTIRFDRTPQQTTDLRNQGSLLAEVHEDKFDELTRYIQANRDVLARSLHLPETEVGTEVATTIPAVLSRKSKFAFWDSAGNFTPVAALSQGVLAVSAFIETFLNNATAAVARATLDVPSTAEAVLDVLVDAKGDLIGASAADTPARVPASATTGLTLVADPAATPGVSWSPRAQDNPIINGNLEVWQRGTTFPAAANNAYAADCWKFESSPGTGVVTLNRSTDVPTVAAAGRVLPASLEIDVTTAEAAIAAGEYFMVSYMMEGYIWQHFAQRAFTVSFLVRDTKTGTHTVSFRNSGNDRSYVATYTITTPDTWEYKTVTVLASPSAGTWDYTTGKGLVIGFPIAAGSNFHTTEGAWQTGNFFGVTAGVNSMDSTSNVFRVTGVKLELGTVATPIRFSSFNEQWWLCQRYFQKSFFYETAPVQNTGAASGETVFISTVAGVVATYHQVRYARPLRTTPTITFYNPSAANAQARNHTDSADCSATGTSFNTANDMVLTTTGNAGLAVGERIGVHWTADAAL